MAQKSSNFTSSQRGAGWIAIATLIWASGGVFEKHLLLSLSPIALAYGSLCFAVAALLLINKLSLMHLYKIFCQHRGLYIVLGLTGFTISYPLLFVALRDLPLGVVAPVIKLDGVFVVLLAPLILRQRPKFLQLALSLIAICCAVLVTVPLSQLLQFHIINFFAFIAGIVSAFCFGSSSIIGKILLDRKVSPLDVTVTRFSTGLVLLTPYIFLSEEWHHIAALPAKEWLIMAGLGIVSDGIGILFYYKGMNHVSAALATIMEMFQVVFGVLFGFLLLHEQLEISQYLSIAGLIAVVGILMMQEDRVTKLAENHSLP